MKSSKIKRVLSLLSLLACCQLAVGDDKIAYYRYINSAGVKVMSHSIPPEFAQRGYEILSETGRVIKVVPPAVTAEDLKSAEARRQLLDEYEQLARRYSATKDIESAKLRQLERLDANIALTRGSINNLQRQIDALTSKAADFERAAKPVPKNVLDNLNKTREEKASSENMMTTRLAEKQKVVDKFEREKVLFEQGAALARPPTSTAVGEVKKP